MSKRWNLRRRRGQAQTEYIILVGLVALVLIAAVNKFAFSVDEAIQGSAAAFRRHTPAAEFASDNGLSPGQKKGVKVGYDENGREVYDVVVYKGGAWVWEYHKDGPNGPVHPKNEPIRSRKP